MEQAVTSADFERCQWEQALAGAARATCFDYFELLGRKRTEAAAAGDAAAVAVFRLLCKLTFSHLRPHSATEPFQDPGQIGGEVLAPITHLSEAELGILSQLAPNIADPEMRARVADVVWVQKRDIKCAQLAVDAYLESARRLEQKPPKVGEQSIFVYSADRAERALRLARMINDQQRFNDVAGYVEQLAQSLTRQLAPLAPRVIDLLVEFDLGDPVVYASITKDAAERAETQNAVDTAREFWTRQAQWLHRAGDSAGERVARVAAAETYVKKAALLEGGTPPSYLLISDCLERAIQAHRQVGGQKDRVDELHARLVAAQQKSVGELKRVEAGQFDATELVRKTIASVTGRPLPEALLGVALLANPPDVRVLREQALDVMKAAPLASSWPVMLMNAFGKTVAKTPPALSNETDRAEAALRFAMARQLAFLRGLSAIAIGAAANQIVLEHPMRLADWTPLVSDNPFIPADRAPIFAEGLHAGLTGNLLVSTHLLVPQVENSFRSLLLQRGVVPSKLSQEGVQEEMHLQQILYLPKFEEIFGANLTFDLKTLLVDHGGPNLRHGTAHGLRSYPEFFGPDALYFWCLTLRLCFPPLLQRVLADAAAAQQTTP